MGIEDLVSGGLIVGLLGSMAFLVTAIVLKIRARLASGEPPKLLNTGTGLDKFIAAEKLDYLTHRRRQEELAAALIHQGIRDAFVKVRYDVCWHQYSIGLKGGSFSYEWDSHGALDTRPKDEIQFLHDALVRGTIEIIELEILTELPPGDGSVGNVSVIPKKEQVEPHGLVLVPKAEDKS